ncbi:hypothetical protein KR059_001158 [Drosophila kikkawai]|nr:hypothetical protein KR059_001158 [Drosophila kikkawai]
MEVPTSLEMFEFFRQMSVPKVSAVILRWMFYLASYLGILCFKFKATTDDKVAMQENGQLWKWFLALFRVGGLCVLIFTSLQWIIMLKDLLRKFLHIIRILANIASSLCLLRLHLLQGTDCTHVVNRFLQLFVKVKMLFKTKRSGFGGKYELVLLILALSGLIYEGMFILHLYQLKKYWIIDVYLSISNKLIMHIAFVGYLTLGLLYADLNNFVSTEFRSQLESLEEQPTRRKLRKARKSLDKCLTLYKDVQSLTFLFQKIFNLPLLLSLVRNYITVALISYSTFINLDISLSWLLTNISIEILNMLLLTLSVHRTKLQFKSIHRLVLENCHLIENKEWNRTLEVFFTHLNLYEFRVRPLGLFDISNELFFDFLSALITYLTVVIQYGMQLETFSLLL